MKFNKPKKCPRINRYVSFKIDLRAVAFVVLCLFNGSDLFATLEFLGLIVFSQFAFVVLPKFSYISTVSTQLRSLLVGSEN